MSRPVPRPSLPPAEGTGNRSEGPGAGPYLPFADYPADVVQDALGRIVASKTFRRSTRHQTFLSHLVRAALEGRHEELKEMVIGLEVFDRKIDDYDPRRDPIVRVEAGRVRDKLARYYAAEGIGDTFEIQIPVGGYLPRLSRRLAAKTSIHNLGSIAVLPFNNLSAIPDDGVFCEALADQLIDMLSRVPGLRVVARVSAFEAQARGLDLKAVGKLLGVTSVVEGSLQRAGSRLRCIAQLYRTRDRACVWSQRFECDSGENDDVFAFQDRIGEAVLAAIAPTTVAIDGPSTKGSAFGVGSNHREARDLFERARYLEQQRTIEGYRKSIRLLERAVQLDPSFASAHSHLGIALSNLTGLIAAPILPAFHEVERHARRALELDPRDGDARTVLANIVSRIECDWPRAEPMFREALRVSPNSSFAHTAYASSLVCNGRYLEALDHGRIALDLDPLNVSLRATYASIATYARDFATAVGEFESILEFDAHHLYGHIMLGMAYLWSARPEHALRHFRDVMTLVPEYPTVHLCEVFVHGFKGEVDVGRRRLAEFDRRFGDSNYARFNYAMAEAYLGDLPGMLVSLRRAADMHELLFTTLPVDPSFDRYRDEPAFAALMLEYHLAAVAPSPFA